MAIYRHKITGREIELLTQEGEFFVDASGEVWDRVALSTQVGGSHYKDMAIQPVEFIHKNGLDYLSGNVVKYISRHKLKNGKEDVLKAIHYCQLILEFQYGEKAL